MHARVVSSFARRRGLSVLLIMLAGGALSIAPPALADLEATAQVVCAKNWPQDTARQATCREQQKVSGLALMKQIEAAPNTSLDFAIAKACIERATVAQPATIDWAKAKLCFDRRSFAQATPDPG